MARTNQIIRTADICDNHRTDARICETQFKDVGGRNHFHGVAVCMPTYEDNSGLRAVLSEGGQGQVLGVKVAGLTAMPPVHETPMKREPFVNFGGITFNTGDYVYADQNCVIVLDKPDHE